MKNRILISLFALLLTLFVGRLYFHEGIPFTHDGENHLARFANYKLALKEGQFPPRIAPTLFNRYGYPVFNYNYPLPSLLSLPFSLAKINYETTFKILVLLSLLWGSFGALLCTKKYGDSLTAQGIVVLLWFTNPFILTTMYYRGSIGEIFAYSLLPWLLRSIQILLQSKITARTFVSQVIFWTLFFLSHNSTVLVVTPLLILLGIGTFGKNKVAILRFSIMLFWAFILSAWFWLPAVFEASATVVTRSANQSAITDHFATMQQLLFAPLSFGFSYSGMIDSLGLSIGWIPFILIAISIGYVVIKKQYTEHSLHYFITISVFLIFLQIEMSALIWKLVPILRFIQFPWRLSLVFFVFLLPVAAHVGVSLQKYARLLFILLMFVAIYSVLNIKPVDYFHKSTIDYDAYTQSTSTQNENVPSNFTYLGIGDWQPSARIIEGDGTISTNFWTTIKHEYTVESQTEVTIVEPVMLFPGWETTANGEKMVYTDDEIIEGRLAFRLVPGKHSVTTIFTQKTMPRVIGNSLSILGCIALGMMVLVSKRKVQKQS